MKTNRAVAAIAGAGLIGLVVGGGVLASASDSSPRKPGVSSTADDYPSSNENGETVGIPELGEPAPDLIPAIGEGGKEGYIRSSESTWGPAANPDEAIEIMRKHFDDNGDAWVPLYELDGKTVIGRVLIAHVSTSESESK